MKLEKGLYVRSDKGFISQINEFIKHYTKGKRLVTSSSVKEVDENYLSLKGNQCEFIDSIDCFIPPCYPSDEEIEKIKRHIIKASFDVIDILEVGDILSFYEDIDNYKKIYSVGIPDLITLDEIIDKIKNDNIRLIGILTHEQMEQMAYKVGE